MPTPALDHAAVTEVAAVVVATLPPDQARVTQVIVMVSANDPAFTPKPAAQVIG